jgi:hypothetical protein
VALRHETLIEDHLCLGGRDDAACDVILNIKEVRQRAVVAVTPDVIACARLQKMNVDADPFSSPPHTAFDDISYAEVVSDLSHIGSGAFVGKGGVPSDEEERVDPRKLCNDVLCDPLSKVILLRGSIHVGEGENSYGWLIGRGMRRELRRDLRARWNKTS